jgi:hypothetical protein
MTITRKFFGALWQTIVWYTYLATPNKNIAYKAYLQLPSSLFDAYFPMLTRRCPLAILVGF